MTIQMHHFFQTELRPKMLTEGIYLLDYADLNRRPKRLLRSVLY